MYTKQHPQSYIDTYNNCYNTSFTELTERYSLFPKGDNEYGYTKEWPNNNMPGVYFVLDQNEELLYIGQSKSLGKRLYNHFPPSSNGCTIKQGETLNDKREALIARPSPNCRNPAENEYRKRSF